MVDEITSVLKIAFVEFFLFDYHSYSAQSFCLSCEDGNDDFGEDILLQYHPIHKLIGIAAEF